MVRALAGGAVTLVEADAGLLRSPLEARGVRGRADRGVVGPTDLFDLGLRSTEGDGDISDIPGHCRLVSPLLRGRKSRKKRGRERGRWQWS